MKVETLVQLSPKKPDSTINVKIEFGEGEGELSLKKIAERIEANKPKVCQGKAIVWITEQWKTFLEG